MYNIECGMETCLFNIPSHGSYTLIYIFKTFFLFATKKKYFPSNAPKSQIFTQAVYPTTQPN